MAASMRRSRKDTGSSSSSLEVRRKQQSSSGCQFSLESRRPSDAHSTRSSRTVSSTMCSSVLAAQRRSTSSPSRRRVGRLERRQGSGDSSCSGASSSQLGVSTTSAVLPSALALQFLAQSSSERSPSAKRREADERSGRCIMCGRAADATKR
eukprot:scaffold129733_cov69-Phaeocystis_antarctica.AAC.6